MRNSLNQSCCCKWNAMHHGRTRNALKVISRLRNQYGTYQKSSQSGLASRGLNVCICLTASSCWSNSIMLQSEQKALTDQY